MTTKEIIQYLRLCMRIQDPEGSSVDSVYLAMTDEEILLYLNVAMSKDFPEYVSLDNLPNEGIYVVTLVARKDLYFTLATVDAPLYDIGADNNNYLKRSQRFEHYMKLITQADKEYNDYLDKGGAGRGTLTSYNVFLPDRYNTRYNYEGGSIPAPLLYVREVGKDFVDLEWKCKVSRFYCARVYVSEGKVIDEFAQKKVIDEKTLLMTIMDVHQTKFRVEGLKPDTEYHIAIGVTELSTLTGYKEIIVTTQTEGD